MIKHIKKILISGAVVAPFLALGQNFTTLNSTLESIKEFIDNLIPVVIGLALVVFLIGIVRFITAGGDEEARQSARNMIIFGIIALFVMVSVWGFVRILTGTFFSNTDPSTAPFRPHTPIR